MVALSAAFSLPLPLGFADGFFGSTASFESLRFLDAPCA